MTATTTTLHGTNSRYQMGCRCLLCTGARAAYQREYRERRKVREIVVEGVVVGHAVEVSEAGADL